MSSQIVSDEEYKEFLEFIDEYKAKKKEKQEHSLLHWVYKRLKGEHDDGN